jgi:hypothetical protein
LQGIVGTSTSGAGDVATKNILQLNTSMFDLYTEAGLTFKKNILAEHPCQRSTHYSNPSPTALWRWPWWSNPI